MIANVDALARRAVSEWKAQQKPPELTAFGELVVRRGYRTLLEVGTYSGGTARFFNALGLKVTAIDKDFGHLEPGATRSGVLFYRSEGAAAVRHLGTFDVVFIDADHSLQAVTEDWQTFGRMARPGGVVAFHDIREHKGAWGGHSQVKTLWEALRGEFRTQEFIHWNDEDCAGIGVLEIDEEEAA